MNVLLIGSGTMGRVHAEAYAVMDSVQLAGIVDIQREQAVQLAERHGTQGFGTYEEAKEVLDKIDVVDICLPTHLHKPLVQQVADDGYHIICEKPLARTLEDARDMINYCRSKGVHLFVGHVLRFFPEYVRVKQVIESGKIGKCAVVHTTRGGIFPTGWQDWYADFEKSGGLVLDMIIHDFDFLRWCFGEVERVYAKGLYGRRFSRLDYALVTLRFKNGVMAHVEGTWAHDGFSMGFEIAGQNGVVEFNSAKERSLVYISRNQTQGAEGVAVPESPLNENPYYLELNHFINCIRTGEQPLVTAEDAYKAMEIALAALESIKTGRVIELNG